MNKIFIFFVPCFIFAENLTPLYSPDTYEILMGKGPAANEKKVKILKDDNFKVSVEDNDNEKYLKEDTIYWNSKYTQIKSKKTGYPIKAQTQCQFVAQKMVCNTILTSLEGDPEDDKTYKSAGLLYLYKGPQDYMVIAGNQSCCGNTATSIAVISGKMKLMCHEDYQGQQGQKTSANALQRYQDFLQTPEKYLAWNSRSCTFKWSGVSRNLSSNHKHKKTKHKKHKKLKKK